MISRVCPLTILQKFFGLCGGGTSFNFVRACSGFYRKLSIVNPASP